MSFHQTWELRAAVEAAKSDLRKAGRKLLGREAELAEIARRIAELAAKAAGRKDAAQMVDVHAILTTLLAEAGLQLYGICREHGKEVGKCIRDAVAAVHAMCEIAAETVMAGAYAQDLGGGPVGPNTHT